MTDANRTVVYQAISTMLDNPNEYGIYPTTKCYDELEAALDVKDAEIERPKTHIPSTIWFVLGWAVGVLGIVFVRWLFL